MSPSEPTKTTYEPRHPTLVATGLLSIWVLILSLPMIAGKFLGSPFSDQWKAGYAYRLWGAEQWKATGHIPLWNPEIFGGLPFVAAMHGDIFYPTAWLRLVLPTSFVMNIEFPVHYLLAGLFTYLLLRRLKVSWSGAVTGGFAYQLSGVIASYVAPGHDGKLYVTALLPLMLIGLIMGQREKRLEGFALCAIAVGLALVSPQTQMTYYLLLCSGIFALYLAFGEKDDRTLQQRVWPLLGALAAVIVGFGIGMIQMLPFYHYLPFSPRSEEISGGYEVATSYAIPWVHVPEFFLSGFVGRSEAATYWGSNGIKFHSEYLGLPVVALAIAGWRHKEHRRLIYWLSGIGLLFLLIGMGSATPFYRLWWAVAPFVKKTRAPGMALYIVSLVLAILAAFGVERLEKGEAKTAGRTWLIVGGVILVLAVGGLFGSIADSMARGQIDLPPQFLTRATQAVSAAQGDIRLGAAGSALGLVLVGLVAFMLARGRLEAKIFALALPLLVGADLWRAGKDFWMYEDAPTHSLYATDTITRLLQKERPPYRVFDPAPPIQGVYPYATLMAFGIPNMMGHHGFELDAFDKLMGGQDEWGNQAAPHLWALFAAKYILLPAANSPDSLPDYHLRLKNVPTSTGENANLFEADSTPPYARLVPAAIKAPEEQAIGALLNPRFNFNSLVTLDSAAPVNPPRITSLPAPLAVNATVTSWAPGHMTVQLQPAAPQAAYLLVAENWYKDWTATVDGKLAPVYRGDVSLITVPVPAGAREVQLAFVSPDYTTGKTVTLISCLFALVGVVIPPVMRLKTKAARAATSG